MRSYLDDNILDSEYRKALAQVHEKQKSIVDNQNSGDTSSGASSKMKNSFNQPSMVPHKTTNFVEEEDKSNLGLSSMSASRQMKQLEKSKFFLHERLPTQIHRKSEYDFGLFLVQDIKASSDAIWASVFSPCGHYLALGGKDAVLTVWALDSSQQQ